MVIKAPSTRGKVAKWIEKENINSRKEIKYDFFSSKYNDRNKIEVPRPILIWTNSWIGKTNSEYIKVEKYRFLVSLLIRKSFIEIDKKAVNPIKNLKL